MGLRTRRTRFARWAVLWLAVLNFLVWSYFARAGTPGEHPSSANRPVLEHGAFASSEVRART